MDFKIFFSIFAVVTNEITVKVKHIINYIVFLACVLLCSACDYMVKPNEETDVAPLIVQRYDRLESRYLTTGDFSALQQMNTDYPIETRTLIEKVLQLGTITDPNISNRFLMFYQDSTLQSLIADAEAEYANMDDINQQLKEAFERLNDWIPELQQPCFYAQIGALDQSIIVGEHSVGISLDKYMGEKYPLYQKFYNAQQRSMMTREYIVPDCLTFYLLSIYPMVNFDNRPQLDRDLHMGKIMWTVNKVMGKKIFDTKYVNTIQSYIKRNPKTTVKQLLENEDYSPIEALHKD